jgi:hypothetical protein
MALLSVSSVRKEEPARNLTDGPRESHDHDPTRSAAPKGDGAGVGGRSRCVDVVDETHALRDAVGCRDAPPDVPPALVEAKAALARQRANAAEEICSRNPPDRAQRASEGAGCDGSTAPRALRVTGDVDEHIDVRPRNDLVHENRGFGGEPAEALLLPGANEGASPLVVDDRGARLREREPPARALGAAAYRPGARRAASLADRRPQAKEPVPALTAERGSGSSTYGAPVGQEQRQQLHAAIVGS